MNLLPLSAQDVVAGEPLPWPLFDEDGHILFNQGDTLPAGYPLTGLFRSPDADAMAAPVPVEEFSVAGPFEEVSAGEMFPPNGIKPQMWEVVQLRLPERDRQPHYFTRLVGYIRNVSILVTTPRIRRQALSMVEGERIEVRMLTGRNIYLFQSQIIKACLAPSPYLHLAFPEQVQRQSLRKAPWAKANLPGTVECSGKHTEVSVVNLSVSGARVDATVPLGGEGESVTLSFQAEADGFRHDFVLQARIRHARRAAAASAVVTEHGLEFVQVTEEEALFLRCLVYQRIAEGFLV
jgi:hypothetical protein